jgi:hypothetical protein
VGAARDGFDVSVVDEAAVGADDLAISAQREMEALGVRVVSVNDFSLSRGSARNLE